MVFFEYERSFEQFQKGLWGNRAQLSPETFQRYWDSRRGLLSVLASFRASSTLSHNLRQVSVYGCFVSIFLTAVGLRPIFVSSVEFRFVGNVFEDLQGLCTQLKYITGFLFSFYSLGRVGWWWEVLNCARSIQGRIHDINMLIAGGLATEDHGDSALWCREKWHVYRFQLLVFILCFRPLAPRLKDVTYEDLEHAGLLEEDEKAVLVKAIHPRKAVLKWLTTWVTGHVHDGHLRSLIADKICGLRGACATLHDTMELRAPYTFEAILYSTVWLWLLLVPFWEINSTKDRKIVLEAGVFFSTLKCVMIAAVYLGMIDLLESFKDPFGWDSDSMNVESILLETETTIVDYLTCPMSSTLKPMCKETLYSEDSTVRNTRNIEFRRSPQCDRLSLEVGLSA